MNLLSGIALAFGAAAELLESALSDASNVTKECTNARELAAVSLAMQGHNADTAYAAAPALSPRALRYVSHAFRKDMFLSISTEEPNTLGTLDSEAVTELTELAKSAAVKPAVAVSAVVRYGNSLERVKSALKDIQALRSAHIPVYSPTGLFTRTMRTGADIKLPARVTAKREQQATVTAAAAAKPVPAVGMLVKAFGELCEIVAVTGRQFVTVLTKDGLCNVNRDSLRFVTS